jgi:hypothetical protein
VIFSRRSRSGRHAKPEEPRGTTLTAAEKRKAQRAAMLEELDLATPGDDPRDFTGRSNGQPVKPAFNPDGPFDLSDDPPAGNRLDLGSIQIPALDGVEIRLQANDAGVVQQVLLIVGESALQIAVLAAPRHEGIWEEVRGDIRKSLFDDGVGAEETEGPWGPELRARLRTQDGFVDLRFVGIDGPRWMIQGVYQGPAAADPLNAELLQECLAGIVISRDEQARPAREPLPMRLPDQVPVQPTPDGEVTSQLVPGPVPPAPEPAFGSPAPTVGTTTSVTDPAAQPRRKPSPRPRRD